VLEQLDRPVRQTTLEVEGHQLPVSNLDKPLWPAAGRRAPLTKRDLLRYFTRVSPWMLLHLADRPLFVTRFPNGVTGKSFYQKHWEDPPPFVRTVSIWSSHNAGDGDYLICENLPTLLWLGQMAGLELHAWYSRTRRAPDALRTGATFSGSEAALDRSVLNYPDFVVFDLDPYLYSGKEARARSPSCIAAPSAELERWPSGCARCSAGWDSRLGSRPRAAPGYTFTFRSCAPSISTQPATWPRRSRATPGRSGHAR